MPSTQLVLLVIVAASASALAQAQDSPFECKPDGNQQEMNACAFNDYMSADEKLNAAYKETIAALPAEKRDKLRKEQRAWLKHRDTRCQAETKSSEGGSIWPLEYYSCLKVQTEKRTEEIAQRKSSSESRK